MASRRRRARSTRRTPTRRTPTPPTPTPPTHAPAAPPAAPSRRAIAERVGELIGPGGLAGLAGIALIAALLLVTGEQEFGAPTGPGIAAPAATIDWQGLESPGQDVGALRTELETFDALPINSGAPSGWTTSGGGSAAVVPLPTSADRSLRLTTGPAGEAAVVCRTIPTAHDGVVRVSLDVLPGAPIPPGLSIATLMANGSTTAEVRAGSADSLVLSSGEGSLQSSRRSPTPALGVNGGWLRVDLTVSSPADLLCVQSPAGASSTWIALDNVSVTS